MYEGCATCMARDYCRFEYDSEQCDEILDRMIEAARIDYYKDWFNYVGENGDFD